LKYKEGEDSHEVPNALVHIPIEIATKSSSSGPKMEGRKIFISDRSVLFPGLHISCREMEPPMQSRQDTDPAGVHVPSSNILACWGTYLGTNWVSQ